MLMFNAMQTANAYEATVDLLKPETAFANQRKLWFCFKVKHLGI